jgi:rubrerythrin
MVHATMLINRGVEVNLARQRLSIYMSDADAKALIPDEGGFIANLFNNEHDPDVDNWIESIHEAIHENRERHRRYKEDQQARGKDKARCPSCDGIVTPRWIKVNSQQGGTHDQAVCPVCGAELD